MNSHNENDRFSANSVVEQRLRRVQMEQKWVMAAYTEEYTQTCGKHKTIFPFEQER